MLCQYAGLYFPFGSERDWGGEGREEESQKRGRWEYLKWHKVDSLTACWKSLDMPMLSSSGCVPPSTFCTSTEHCSSTWGGEKMNYTTSRVTFHMPDWRYRNCQKQWAGVQLPIMIIAFQMLANNHALGTWKSGFCPGWWCLGLPMVMRPQNVRCLQSSWMRWASSRHSSGWQPCLPADRQRKYSVLSLWPESYPTGTMDTNPATSVACEYKNSNPYM